MKKSTFTLECLCNDSRQPARIAFLGTAIAYVNSDNGLVLICQQDFIGLGDDLTFTVAGVRYIDEGVIISRQILSNILEYAMPSACTNNPVHMAGVN